MAMLMERRAEIADYVMRAGQLAAALEVCGWPKPGNVHRTADFKDLRFEHFIAGSIAMGPSLREAALRGVAVGLNELELNKVGVGELVRRAVADAIAWQRGGDTHLGTILLLTPLAVAAGATIARRGFVDAIGLRESFTKVMESTRPEDAVNVYEAIAIARPTGLGRVEGRAAPDVSDERAKEALVERGLSLYDVMRIAAEWDTIALELTTGLRITFEVGCPTLLSVYVRTLDINVAIVHTYLTLLSSFPDTHVARIVGLKRARNVPEAVKIGVNKAKEVAEEAAEILRLGGLITSEGKAALFKFDERLRNEGLNPGTTADLTAASLMVAILYGLRF